MFTAQASLLTGAQEGCTMSDTIYQTCTIICLGSIVSYSAHLPQACYQVLGLSLQLMIQHNVENVLDLRDCLPSDAAAAHHCCQVLWCDQVSLQQVQADSSTEALQKRTPFTVEGRDCPHESPTSYRIRNHLL